MYLQVTGNPTLTISGTNYSASVPVTAYDDDNTPIGWESLIITGLISESVVAFKTKLKAAADAWKPSVVIAETLKAKLGRLEGMRL